MAKSRPAPSALMAELLKRNFTGTKRWWEQIPKDDLTYLLNVFDAYSKSDRKPSIRALHEKLKEVIDLPVGKGALGDYLKSWLEKHEKKSG